MKLQRGKDLSFIPASHEDPRDPGVMKKILLSKQDIIKGRVQMINWALLPPGKSFRLHYHEDMDEIFILTSGRAVMIVNDEEMEMEKGDTVVVPMESNHKMWNKTETDVEYIVIGVTTEKGGKTVVVEK
jgi:mannose-6-phosphate isomerase-like protein (cupin superfamily)